jgi:hypothetical protein
MNPHTLKEDLSSGLDYGTLLIGCQNCHLRESINDHEDTVITSLDEGRSNM